MSKPENVYRIIVIGDSFTFGLGVELNESYLKQLENILNSKSKNYEYEVLNMGIPGYTTLQEISFLIEKGIKYNPNMIVLEYLSDDIMNKSEYMEIRAEIIRKHNRTEESKTWNTVDEFEAIYEKIVSQRPFEKSWETVGTPLKILNNITKERNISVIVFFIAQDFRFNMTRQKEELIKTCNEYNWTFVDTAEIYRRNKLKDLTLNKYDLHPNAFAYRLYAEALYPYVINISQELKQ